MSIQPLTVAELLDKFNQKFCKHIFVSQFLEQMT